MTTPTEAQIDAAGCTHDFSERESSVYTEGYCPLCMAAELSQLRRHIALTAAAEVGEPSDSKVAEVAKAIKKAHECYGNEYTTMACAAIEAAAATEVGMDMFKHFSMDAKSMTKPLTEGLRKGGRNTVSDDFVRPEPPPAFRAKAMTTPTKAQIIEAVRRVVERCRERNPSHLRIPPSGETVMEWLLEELCHDQTHPRAD